MPRRDGKNIQIYFHLSSKLFKKPKTEMLCVLLDFNNSWTINFLLRPGALSVPPEKLRMRKQTLTNVFENSEPSENTRKDYLNTRRKRPNTDATVSSHNENGHQSPNVFGTLHFFE